MQALEAALAAPIVEAYGMTEAAHQIASNPLPPGERRPGSVGLPSGPSVGIMDEDGRLRFATRLKDVFRVGGENVAPAEVEDALHKHPKVKQAQVVGVPDPRLIEVPAAYVILKDGARATSEEIVEWSKARMANFRVPRYVKIVDSFETIGMTGSAKIQKNKLRAQALIDFGLGSPGQSQRVARS